MNKYLSDPRALNVYSVSSDARKGSRVSSGT